MGARILLVENEPAVVLALSDRLAREGYQVETARDAEAGLERAVSEPFDLIVLDLRSPRSSGLLLVRELRRQGMDLPILMITDRVCDKIVSLKLGADDCLAKPFEMLELVARLEALLRRSRNAEPANGHVDVYRFGDVQVDLRSASVSRAGKDLRLTAREFQLLRHFISHREAALSRDEILNEVWGCDAMPVARTVDVHVAWLRRKLEPNPHRPRFILTVHGFGYRFVG